MTHQKDRFTPRMFRRLLIPSLASSLGLAFADMADAVVVGQRMGAVGLAAISLALPFYMVLNLFMHGFGIGGSVRYSQLLGEGRAREAVACFNRVMRTALLVSILVAAAVNLFPDLTVRFLGASPDDAALYQASKNYVQIIALGSPLFFLNYMLNYFLRNDDNQRLASVGFLLGNGVDIFLNLVFVLWLNLQTTGAALATLIGLAVSIVCYLPGIFGKSHILRPAFPKPDFREVWNCLKNGLATSSQYLFQMVFLLIANHVLVRMSGENGVAVFDMVQNASYLVLYLYEGTTKAMQPLASTFYGEKNYLASRRTLSLSLICGMIAGGLVTVFMVVFPGWMCLLFGLHQPELIQLGSHALRIFCAGVTFAGISILLETYCQSSNEEKSAFLIAFLRGCAVLIPCTVLFSFVPLDAFWWLFPVTELVSLGGFLIWWRFLHKKRSQFDQERVFCSTIRNQNEDISKLTGGMEAFCERWNATGQQQYFVQMAAEEICLAIITQAFSEGSDGEIQVTLVALPDGDFELHIRDNAAFFDPFSLHSGKAGQQDEFNPDAMGMMVIKKQAKDFFYRQYQGFNTVVVRI